MRLAVALTVAVPLAAIVAGLGLSEAVAPLLGGVKVTWPPATGSEPADLTVTTSGAAKAWVGSALWLLPPVTLRLKPTDSNAPISTAAPWLRRKPRWSVG